MTTIVPINDAQRQAILDTEQEQVRKIVAAAREGAANAGRDLIFFAAFDGTNNDLDNVGNAKNTNVAQLYRQAERVEHQHPNLFHNYYPGPGTKGTLRKSAWMRGAVTAQVIGTADRAYSEFAETASQWLANHPGARVTAAITGFSRGCASAAIFSQRLNERGLVEPGTGRSLVPPGGVKVVAGVLFDPVMTGVECDLGYPPSVDNVVCIRAQDEYRQLFKGADYSTQSCIKCVDMLGNHCDIGGGYDKDGISALSLGAATDFFRRSGVPVAEVDPKRRFAGVESVAIHSEEVDDLDHEKWDTYDSFRSLTIKTPSPRITVPVIRPAPSRTGGGAP